MLVWILLACNGEDKRAPVPAPVVPLPASVVYIVMDGVRSDECTLPGASDLTGLPGPDTTPRLWETVGADGVVVPTLQNPGITVTGPAHVQLATGRLEEIANFGVDATLGIGNYLPVYPTLFDQLRTEKGLDETQARLVTNASLVESMVASLYPGLGKNIGASVISARHDRDVAAELEAVIAADKPRLLVANLHVADLEGHHGEDGAYLTSVAEEDALVADLYTWIKEKHPDYFANLLFIVTSDHGRHRNPDDPIAWREHGDSCAGCRDMPLFMAGGAVTGRGVSAERFDQLDLTATVAAHLGIDMAFAEGFPMTDLVAVSGAPPSGVRDVVAGNGLTAWREHTGDPASRDRLVADGDVLAEGKSYFGGLVMLDQPVPTLCWREIDLDQEDNRPWVMRCARRHDGAWTGLAGPERIVGLYGTPAMVPTSRGTGMVYVDNPTDTTSSPQVSLAWSEFDETLTWSTPVHHYLQLPANPSAVSVDNVVYVAAAISANEQAGRYNRSIGVYSITEGVWATLGIPDVTQVLTGRTPRVERPAITSVDGTLRLAALGVDDDRRVILYTESPDLGVHWVTSVALPLTGDPYQHVTPRWDEDRLVWAEVSVSGLPAICAMRPEDAAPACLELPGDHLDSFDVDAGRVVASVRVDGAWTVVERELGD